MDYDADFDSIMDQMSSAGDYKDEKDDVKLPLMADEASPLFAQYEEGEPRLKRTKTGRSG